MYNRPKFKFATLLQVSVIDSSKEKALWQGDISLPIHMEAITQSVEELFSLKSDHTPQVCQDSETLIQKNGSKKDGKVKQLRLVVLSFPVIVMLL